MPLTIYLDNVKYTIETPSPTVQSNMTLLKFTEARIEELDNTMTLLRCARVNYVESLKKEIILSKANITSLME